MKDFYDMYILSRDFDFDGDLLSLAIKRTFDRRGSKLPNEVPIGLSEEFSADGTKAKQWKAFASRIGETSSAPELTTVIEHLKGFLWPAAEAASNAQPLKRKWRAGDTWE